MPTLTDSAKEELQNWYSQNTGYSACGDDGAKLPRRATRRELRTLSEEERLQVFNVPTMLHREQICMGSWIEGAEVMKSAAQVYFHVNAHARLYA